MEEYQQADVHDEQLLPHGFGDGAGGATEDMLEQARRFKNLAGMPEVSWSRAEDYFDRLQGSGGPLYRFIKVRCIWSTIGGPTPPSMRSNSITVPPKKPYLPMRRLSVSGGKALSADHWLRTIFVQFHDAIPGSSITRVYDELNPELEATISP